MLIDTHCHLDFPQYDADRKQVLERAAAQDVRVIVNIGSSLKGSRQSVALAQEYACIYATVGVHPHDADTFTGDTEGEIRALAGEKKVVAVGEIGLDYYRLFSQVDNQKKVFEAQLSIAKERNLPVVLHSRDAQEDTREIISRHLPFKAVVHCFTQDEGFFDACLAMGFMISFTCNITYKKAENLRRLIRRIPLERLMLETDAPYLSPEGFRGQRNEPVQVAHLAAQVAALKGISPEDVARQTTDNALKFFGIPS